MADRQPGGVQSVERTFQLLECLSDGGGEMSLSDLAAASGLPMPTIYRLLRTLLTHGYVRQLSSRRYALGPRLINLGVNAGNMVSEWARPWLGGLVETLGETANLCLLDGDRATYVAQVPSKHTMRAFTEIGRRVYLHSTGVGKALLAQLDDDRISDLVSRTGLPAATPTTITNRAALLAQIADIRANGYAIDDGEQEIGVRCVAVPVLDTATPMAISVSGPTPRMTAEPRSPGRSHSCVRRRRSCPRTCRTYARRPDRAGAPASAGQSPRRSSRPPGASPTRSPRSQVSCTTPRRVRPSYGVTGLRWCRRAGSTRNVASGANTTRSASLPTAIEPLPSRPTSAAGAADIQRTTSAS